ncbi:MAG TPA: alpha-ketoacid dehydrogenase subunit beta [Rhodospirillales bacterium]|nr:alpha-ketoacid dehydrogenase subunit beta [Rhodospirillales bacterium]
MTRQLKYFEAIREAQDQCLAADPSVVVMGLGVPDPRAIFGTTAGLAEKYGPKRVMDIPLSENAMTGVCIGAALNGMRPVLTHQRLDFALLSMEQIVNQAAKWHYMFGGQSSVPLVIRMIIGRGWGQGPQHSQSLHSWFAHIPGLKVIMPTTAYDAKGLLIAAIEDNNPVISIEHRWLFGIPDAVPENMYRSPIGKVRILREGTDISLVSCSYMAMESLRAAEKLADLGIDAEVVDLATLRPLDEAGILRSVEKTGRLVAIDGAGVGFGVSAEILALATEHGFGLLKRAPVRIGLPDHPTPTSPALADGYYPRHGHIVACVLKMFKQPVDDRLFDPPTERRLDQPDPTFIGPF